MNWRRWQCGRLINEAIDATLIPVAGPVHVNVPFAEPLYGTTEVDAPVSRTIAQVMTESFILPEHARWMIHQLSTQRKVIDPGRTGCVEQGPATAVGAPRLAAPIHSAHRGHLELGRPCLHHLHRPGDRGRAQAPTRPR